MRLRRSRASLFLRGSDRGVRSFRSASWVLLAAWLVPAYASELVHLRSGFDLEATSHTSRGLTYSFETGTGSIELPKADVVAIENLPAAPAPHAAPHAAPASPSGPDIALLIQSIAISVSNTPEFSRLVRCVADVESRMRQDAMSPKGAKGIMQLMPETAKQFGVDIANSTGNVRGGTLYLKQLLVQYHSDAVLALAAYNAGPGAVQKYGGVPPFFETRTYIRKVLDEYARLQRTEAPPQ